MTVDEETEQEDARLDEEMKQAIPSLCFGNLPNCTCRAIYERLRES